MARSNRAARWRALQMLPLGMFQLSVPVHPGMRSAVRKGIVQRTAQSIAQPPPNRNQDRLIGMVREQLRKRDPIRALLPWRQRSLDTGAVPPKGRIWPPSAWRSWRSASPRIASTAITASAARPVPAPASTRPVAAARQGDTLVVPKQDRLARSVPDARTIADQLRERGVKLAPGRALYDPDDPLGRLFFNILATFAEFEADLIRMRTREGMAIARAKGKLRGKQPKLSDRQQRELCRMYATGEYSISDLAELFSVSRPTVYRTLKRRHSP